MADIKDLRDKMANIATEARSKLDEIKDDTPAERASEIEAEFDKMMAEHTALDQRASREEKLDKAKREAEAYAQGVESNRRPGQNAEARNESETPTYRDAFHSWVKSQVNEGEPMTAEERSVLKAGWSAPDKRAQATSPDSAGGYTVPEEMQNILIKSLAAWGPMYDDSLTTVISTTGGNSLPLPTVNDTAVTAAAAPSQGTTLTDDGGKDVTFGTKNLDSYSYDTEWIRVSLELANDSIFAMESLLGQLLGERLGRKLNSELTIGSGSSAPNGIVTASALGKTAAAATVFTADEILELIHSVDPAYRASPKKRIMFNDTTLLALHKLKDGQGNYLIQSAPDGTGMLTIGAVSVPYTVNQAMVSAATTTKPIVFGDFSKYFVRKAGQVMVGSIQDKDFWPGFGMAGYARVDGELGDTAAVKHLVMA